MFEGSLTYRSRVGGLEFRPIEYKSGHSYVTRVEVSSDGKGEVAFTVHVGDVPDRDEGRAVALHEATRAADVISFERGRPVEDPRLVEDLLREYEVDPQGNKVYGPTSISQGLTLHAKAEAVVELGEGSVRRLRDALSSVSLPGEADYVLFRTALNAQDSASKFLALYRILAHLAGRDNQTLVDAMIARCEPAITTSPSPYTGKPETVYTRLRNEYMHDRPGVSLAATRAEMDACVDGLLRVVRAAIRRP